MHSHLPGLQCLNPVLEPSLGHKYIWLSNLWDSWENTDFPPVPSRVSVFFLSLIDFLLSNWYIEREERLVSCLPFSIVNSVCSCHECSKEHLLVKPQHVWFPDHSSAVTDLPEAHGLPLEDTGIWEGVGGTCQVFRNTYHSFYVKILILRLLKWTKKMRLNL